MHVTSCDAVQGAACCLHREIDALCQERALGLELVEAGRADGDQQQVEVLVLDRSIAVLEQSAHSLTLILTDGSKAPVNEVQQLCIRLGNAGECECEYECKCECKCDGECECECEDQWRRTLVEG